MIGGIAVIPKNVQERQRPSDDESGHSRRGASMLVRAVLKMSSCRSERERSARTCRQFAYFHTGNAVVCRTVLKANDE